MFETILSLMKMLPSLPGEYILSIFSFIESSVCSFPVDTIFIIFIIADRYGCKIETECEKEELSMYVSDETPVSCVVFCVFHRTFQFSALLT